jgi:hypothetical protein
LGSTWRWTSRDPEWCRAVSLTIAAPLNARRDVREEYDSGDVPVRYVYACALAAYQEA